MTDADPGRRRPRARAGVRRQRTAGRGDDGARPPTCATTSCPTTGIDARVGGFNAASVDFADYLGDRLPWLIGAVLILSFILLMVVFRSLLVPLKAVIMNLLSIGAAYGVVVAVFQWGWGASLIGVDREGPIEAWAPMMMFAIVFGLSMDYEIFLLSRMKEEYDRTRRQRDRGRRRPRRHRTGDHRRRADHGVACSRRSCSATTAR